MNKEPILRNKGRDILWPLVFTILFGMVWGAVLTLFVQHLFRH